MSTIQLNNFLSLETPVTLTDEVAAQLLATELHPALLAAPKITKGPFYFYVSGALLDYIASRDPVFFKPFRQEFDTGVIIPLAGAYYDPYPPAARKDDIVGQFILSRERILQLCGVTCLSAYISPSQNHRLFEDAAIAAGLTFAYTVCDQQLTALSMDLSLPSDTPHVLSHCAQNYLRITRDLTSEIAKIQATLRNDPLRPHSSERLARAKAYFYKCQASDFYQPTPAQPSEQNRLDMAFFDSITRAIVDLEATLKPEVDPNHGWVRLWATGVNSDDTERLVLDTQLMRLVFAPVYGGALTEWLFKPRKLNFSPKYINPSDQTSFSIELNGNCVSSVPIASVIRQSPDIIVLRFAHRSEQKEAQVSYFLEYTFKAGLGAYRSNSTTGFSIDYWFDEAPLEDNQSATFVIKLVPPARCLEATSALRLLPAGGVDSENILPLPTAKLAPVSSLHGLRLVDGLNSYVIDIRSTKALSDATIETLFDDQACGEPYFIGLELRFTIPVSELIGSDARNTLFISLT